MIMIVTAVLVAGFVGVNAGANPASSAVLAGHPVVALSAPVSGSAAVKALGVHLPDLARAYGWTSAELVSRLSQDRHLNVDKNGYLLYKEAAPTAGELAAGAAAIGASGAAPLAPLAETFRLHSLPGAARTIYLDFDGETLHANAWTAGYNGGADILAPPFDTDGNPASFSDAELTAVQQVWQRVAEDYAPFDVDVTTEYEGEDHITRSNSGDNIYGMRVLISPISSYFGQYGGVAYVGVFNAVGDYYKPALVFPENLANNERYIAEGASHENGHTLGLTHDGTTTGTEYYAGQGSGATGWAPIMGVGYYRPLTQWSKGEYANASNTEDDIAKIAVSGAPLRSDDVGSSMATATALPGSGAVAGSGTVGAGGDLDYFRVTSGDGTLTAGVTVADRGPNLDAVLELRDASDTVITSGNPIDQLTANLTTNVGAGTYYLVVRGTGKGDPIGDGYTDYGSMGRYTLSADVPSLSNAAPVPSFSANPATGTVPLPVVFDGSTSSDVDGTIQTYAWDFGDGGTSTAASGAHTYSAVGTYTARLTVTDDGGATASTTVTITVTQDPAKVLKVASITLTRIGSSGRYVTTAAVRIVNGNGAVVTGAVVTGRFSGPVAGTVSGTTNSSGTVTLKSRRYPNRTTETFMVTKVSKSGYVFER